LSLYKIWSKVQVKVLGVVMLRALFL